MAGATGGRTNERQVLSVNYANGPLALQVMSVSGGPNVTSATTAATDDKSKQQWSGGPITGDNTGVEVYGTIFSVAESPVQRGVIWTGSDDGRP